MPDWQGSSSHFSDEEQDPEKSSTVAETGLRVCWCDITWLPPSPCLLIWGLSPCLRYNGDGAPGSISRVRDGEDVALHDGNPSGLGPVTRLYRSPHSTGLWGGREMKRVTHGSHKRTGVIRV